MLSCAEPSGPATHGHDRKLLIGGTEDGAIVVDLDWRGIVRRSGPRFVSHGPVLLDARNTLITVGYNQSGDQVMVGLDAGLGLELWRVTIAEDSVPVVLDGVELGASVIAAHPTRTEVFLWRAERDGTGGVAAYDFLQDRITRFFGPINGRFRDMAATTPTPEHPSGCLVIGADAGPPQTSRAFLHVACGNDIETRDSIAIDLPSRFVRQMRTTPDGRTLLVMTDQELLKYDALTMELKVKAVRPLGAPFFMTRNGGRLIIPDVGSSVVASTGIIFVLDASLELALVVDLRVLEYGERPLGILGAEESLDRRWLYILGGIPRDGPLYGPERTHVVVIDQETGEVADVVRLSTFGGGSPFLVP